MCPCPSFFDASIQFAAPFPVIGKNGRRMVKTGHMAQVQQMSYSPPGDGGRAEVMTFERLRLLNAGGTQRADFHVIALVSAGRAHVSVDFAGHDLGPGSIAWIAPGAVHRWDDIALAGGELVLFEPTAPVTATTRALVSALDQPVVWALPDTDRVYVNAALAHLRVEAESPSMHRPPEQLGILLSALLSRLRPVREAQESDDPRFAAFRRAVETGFREHRDVDYYARLIGYAPRTITRAALRATGRTAKEYISDRVALEAKRLLVHEGLSAAQCAAALGFPDASNFSVFFRKIVGCAPGAWRHSTSR